ncbi:hypothetical protein [Sulfodiicoccus acidiphilus]|uniref:hypothetical protein n=1 Tax=Sulfodiicoccus acidiphilus TaxID=1670455 RepID=UPI00166C7D5A|nr:hypothetical protein [Sulfodiicoccus acidiphilus]
MPTRTWLPPQGPTSLKVEDLRRVPKDGTLYRLVIKDRLVAKGFACRGKGP